MLARHAALSAARLRGPRRGLKVYTRTGDGGTSQLFNGQRRPKTDPVFEALGAVDELNAAVGVARAFVARSEALEASALGDQLEQVQSRLLDAGASVATPTESSPASKLSRAAFAGDPGELEAWIDAMDEALPPLTTFILPSGGLAAAQLHVARTVCRRAERRAVDCGADADVRTYLNRLSDYLFVAARSAAAGEGEEEVAYRPCS